MARISYIEIESASADVREVYDKTLKGKPGSFHKILAHRPEVLKTMLPFYSSVGRSLDRRLYELVYIRVSMMNGCHYCTQHHLAGSKKAGLTREEWQHLRDGKYSGFSDRERIALDFAEKLTRNPSTIGDSDIRLLKEHFSDGEIADLHFLVGLANLTNRLTGPLALDFEMAVENV